MESEHVPVVSEEQRALPEARWQFSSRWNRIVRGIGAPLLEPLSEQGRRGLGLHLGDEPLTLPNRSVHLRSVLVIVSQGGMDVRQRDGGVSRHNLIRAHVPANPEGP